MTELEKCLRLGRKTKKMTQRDLADLSGVDLQAIINLESSIYVPLDRHTLNTISAAAGVNRDLFFSMYKAAFQCELKEKRSQAVSPCQQQQEPKPCEPSASLSPDLIDLGKDIMSMPSDAKNSLIHTISMLVHAQKLELGIGTA